jgi:flagellar basal-body rod protein FlgB
MVHRKWMDAVSDNMANVNTPGFLAGRVDFESSLRGALSSGESPSVDGGQVLRSLEPTNTNGNNVNLDSETIIATETGLRYQLALNALDGKYNVMRSALRTQSPWPSSMPWGSPDPG